YLEELIVDEVSYATDTVVASYDFVSDSEGWQFAGTISPYDTPLSSVIPGSLGLSANGSTNCFSYWYSPDIPIQENKVYRALWRVASNVTEPDECVQFRLRSNQKGSWQAWSRLVNSNYQNAPTTGSPKDYYFILTPDITGTDDNLLVFSFDIMSFDPSDDTSSWLYLDAVRLEEITIIP
ncbi:hypothetical protein J7M23_06575, partial [Candidatus Sumerlaeota bacterium]|nr:hypothetical protein [Candidatus Sumerlaeota bacterium]